MGEEVTNVFASIVFAVAFLVPGYVANTIARRFAVHHDSDIQLAILRYATYSLLVYASCYAWLCHPIVSIVESKRWFTSPRYTATILFCLMFLIPIGVGLGVGVLSRLAFALLNYLRRRNIPLLGHDPSSWDYVFRQLMSKKLGPILVLVFFKSGKKKYGIYADQSHAGLGHENCDLYLEKKLDYDEATDSYSIVDGIGLIVWREDVERIEFQFWNSTISTIDAPSSTTWKTLRSKVYGIMRGILTLSLIDLV